MNSIDAALQSRGNVNELEQPNFSEVENFKDFEMCKWLEVINLCHL